MTDTQSSPLDKYTFYERSGGMVCDDMNYELETCFGSNTEKSRKSGACISIGTGKSLKGHFRLENRHIAMIRKLRKTTLQRLDFTTGQYLSILAWCLHRMPYFEEDQLSDEQIVQEIKRAAATWLPSMKKLDYISLAVQARSLYHEKQDKITQQTSCL